MASIKQKYYLKSFKDNPQGEISYDYYSKSSDCDSIMDHRFISVQNRDQTMGGELMNKPSSSEWLKIGLS